MVSIARNGTLPLEEMTYIQRSVTIGFLAKITNEVDNVEMAFGD